MAFSNTTLSIMTLVSLILAVVAVGILASRLVKEHTAKAQSPLPPDERLEVLVEAHARSIKKLQDAMRQLAGGERRLAELFQGALQHVAVVRFDAFEDMGGRLSYSAALLDARGDGVVITSINGRQDARCYAKPVSGGTSIQNLSDEEEQAIREAMHAARQTVEAR